MKNRYNSVPFKSTVFQWSKLISRKIFKFPHCEFTRGRVGEATKMRLFSDVNIVKKKKDFERKGFTLVLTYHM